MMMTLLTCVTKENIILVPGMYLRQLNYFDFIIYLDSDIDVLVERKIARSEKLEIKRDPKITKSMITMLEHPVMEEIIRNNLVKDIIQINTTDFENVYFLD